LKKTNFFVFQKLFFSPELVIDRILALHNNEPATLVVVSRYLHRPLFSHLHKLVAKGGLLSYHTFMVGAESVGRKTPTKSRFLLNEGELRTAFQDDFDILGEFFLCCFLIIKNKTKKKDDSIILLPDKRPTSCFLAKRK
jgi:hypothetical protein